MIGLVVHPEGIEELRAARAEEKKLKKLQNEERIRQEEEARSHILPRAWIKLPQSSRTAPASEQRQCKVMTWNLLAQCLVRRTLFPTSDCLKASERDHMTYREIISHNADICCLQEVDRTEKLFPVLKEAGYNHVYKAGPQKKHGCLIAFRSEVLELYAQKQIPYDDHEVHPDAPVTTPFVKRCGSSFRTKNIANLVALKWKDSEDGVIVATTHLFWHPSYTYERTRQAAILLREVSRFRHGLGKDNWPCIVAGDFNFAPDDPAYSLLVGDALSPRQSSRLDVSRVVHHTIDPNVPITTKKMMGEDEGGAEGEEKDPDRIIVNARKAVPDDGLLTDEQLREICTRAGQAFSAYDRGLSQDKTIDAELLFGSRVPLERGKQGAAEPVWTSYTHFWKVVLDYIFVLDPKRDVTVVGVAAPHPTKDLDPGLPRKGVCASDHISLCADLTWSAS